MTTKSVSVSLINHHPHWEGTPVPSPLDLTKHNVGGEIYYRKGNPFSFDIWPKVDFGQDLTEERIVPEGEIVGVKFFWEDRFGNGVILRRTAWHDQAQQDQGKPWGWVGMFWLFDIISDSVYEYTACGVALTKFDPGPWPWRAFRAD